jgi:hypothetical protein
VHSFCVGPAISEEDALAPGSKLSSDHRSLPFGAAERAVRAGLALIEAVGKLRTQEPLQVRIGIATGDFLPFSELRQCKTKTRRRPDQGAAPRHAIPGRSHI